MSAYENLDEEEEYGVEPGGCWGCYGLRACSFTLRVVYHHPLFREAEKNSLSAGTSKLRRSILNLFKNEIFPLQELPACTFLKYQTSCNLMVHLVYSGLVHFPGVLDLPFILLKRMKFTTFRCLDA